MLRAVAVVASCRHLWHPVAQALLEVLLLPPALALAEPAAALAEPAAALTEAAAALNEPRIGHLGLSEDAAADQGVGLVPR